MTCPDCGGNPITVEDTSADGVTRQNTKTCQTCHGRELGDPAWYDPRPATGNPAGGDQ